MDVSQKCCTDALLMYMYTLRQPYFTIQHPSKCMLQMNIYPYQCATELTSVHISLGDYAIHIYITVYGSTLYIGIAMVFVFPPYI